MRRVLIIGKTEFERVNKMQELSKTLNNLVLIREVNNRTLRYALENSQKYDVSIIATTQNNRELSRQLLLKFEIIDMDKPEENSAELIVEILQSFVKSYQKWKLKNDSDKIEEHECKYCGAMTAEPDENCYKAPQPREFKVGDKVFDIRHGWGTVEMIKGGMFPVIVFFADIFADPFGRKKISFTSDGRTCSHLNPSLSHTEYGFN